MQPDQPTTDRARHDFAQRLQELTERWNDPRYCQQQRVLANLRRSFAEAERKREAERRATWEDKRNNLTLVFAGIAALGTIVIALAAAT